MSEQHHFLIKIMSGLIRAGTVIAATRCVPAGLPWIRLSLPLPWQCLSVTTGNFISDGGRESAVFSLGYVSVSFGLEGVETLSCWSL